MHVVRLVELCIMIGCTYYAFAKASIWAGTHGASWLLEHTDVSRWLGTKLIDGYQPNHVTDIETRRLAEQYERELDEQNSEMAAAWSKHVNQTTQFSALDNQHRQWDALQYEYATSHTVITRHATGSFRMIRRYVKNLRVTLSPEELKYGNVQFKMVPTDSIKPDVDLIYPMEG